MSSWNDLVLAARITEIPAPKLRAITLAQWIIESGRGKSDLAQIYNNFGGLKWRPEMKGYANKILYEAHDGADFYCSFSSAAAFIRGYWRFIERPPYNGWEKYSNDPRGYISFLKARGYAQDKVYVEKVISALPEAEQILGKDITMDGILDVESDIETDRPSRAALGESIESLLAADEQPEFVTLAQIKHKFRGSRPNGLEGAIVHYDAGRTKPTKGADDTEWGARNGLMSGANDGFAFATVSRTGKIYLPGNFDWMQWGYHAGESRCPVTKRDRVSQYYVGFEVNSPGLVYPTANANVFVPWFDAVRDEKGHVILDDKGHATVKNQHGELYKKAELRIVAKKMGNIAPGAYVPYTDAQYISLVNVMLWLKRQFKKNFRLDLVFGHDEVAPGRKVDPGASLGKPSDGGVGAPMTMSHFRVWTQLIQ